MLAAARPRERGVSRDEWSVSRVSTRLGVAAWRWISELYSGHVCFSEVPLIYFDRVGFVSYAFCDSVKLVIVLYDYWENIYTSCNRIYCCCFLEGEKKKPQEETLHSDETEL